MSRQTNILSFDEVKRDVDAYRPSRAVPSMPPRFSDDLSTFESPFRQTSARTTATRGSRARAFAADGRPRAASGFGSDLSPTSYRGSRSTSARPAAPRVISTRSLAEERSAVQRRAERVRGEDEPEEPREVEHLSRFAAYKKKRAKDKAERAFTKQFGGERQAGADAPSGSRAAVYKGEMGAKHRQAARMQNEASTNASQKRGFSLGSLVALKSSPKFIATAAVAACLALSCVFLYPAAQQYYHAVREHDRLEAEYAALEDRNTSLQSDVASLQTDSGVEMRAHDQFGWVKAGEETATVRGLDLSEEDTSTFRANITSGSIEAPDTWYSAVLDPLFGVK